MRGNIAGSQVKRNDIYEPVQIYSLIPRILVGGCHEPGYETSINIDSSRWCTSMRVRVNHGRTHMVKGGR